MVSSGTWTTTANLNVGRNGAGALTVNGGVVATGSNSHVGLNAGSTGVATVSSGTWTTTNSLLVGSGGAGTLDVTGGLVVNNAATIGNGAGSNGSVTMSAGTWTSSGNLTVGGSGTGTLTMNGGLVTVGGALTRGSGGTINLNAGGSLQIGTGGTQGVLLGGTSSFVNDGTLIFNRSNAFTYSGVLSGSGAVVKQGAGTFTLSATSTYSGPTSVSAGTLLVNGRLANSAVTVGNGGTLGGNGSVGALVTVQSGGVLSPGSSPGALAAAALDLEAGSTTFMEVIGSGATAGTAGTDYDQFQITTPSSLTYGGSLVLSFIGNPLFDLGTSFSLFQFTGVPGGGFGAVTTAVGSSTYSGKTFQLNANGNWYTPDTSAGQYLVFDPASGRLSIVPEPSTWVLACLGIAALALKARRRSRSV
jgi:autotransporter-associated beta strand protein/T5SS/PEP-CTERM-associated repeat protein